MNICLIGLGYWGPNLARNLKQLGALSICVDKDESKRKKILVDPTYTGINVYEDWEYLLKFADVDAVVIATPPDTHYEIAKTWLGAGKHVFVEKPMTLVATEAEELVLIAQQKNLVLMVGHTFLYSPDILKMKKIITDPAFGKLFYMYTKRLNLGKIQRPANVIEDLAPHDFSIFNYISDKRCVEVQSFGTSCILKDSEDVAFINLRYEDGVIAHLHLSWLDPLKVRETVMVGSKQMVHCDSGNKEVRIYNKCVDIAAAEENANKDFSHHLLTYKYGDMISPYIETTEPLRAEMLDFIECINSGRRPLSDGVFGWEIVKMLEAAQISLRSNGEWAEVK